MKTTKYMFEGKLSIFEIFEVFYKSQTRRAYILEWWHVSLCYVDSINFPSHDY